MATMKISMSTGQVQKLVDFFDGYSDDQIVSCKYESKAGIKAIMVVESELKPADAAAHLKSVFKKTPDGQVLYFSIQPM